MRRAVLLVALIAACGGGSGGAPDAGPPDGPTLDECEALGVDAVGACAEGGIRRCEDQHVVVVPCEGGSHCDASSGAPACVSDACATVGPNGRCAGDTLASCDTGALVETDCAATGQVCAYGGDVVGYACVAPASTGDLVVDGTVRYEDEAPLENGNLGAITQVVSRGARVSVVRDSDSAVLATAITADDGTFRLHYTAAAAAPVHVLAVAQDPIAARPITVVNRQNRAFGVAGATFAAAATATSDVLATFAAAQVSEPFNILDQLTRTMDMIRSELGDATPRGLQAIWAVGSTDGTYYDGQIHLYGKPSDDDGYDDTVILHESGHYIEDTEGRSDNPGGGHNGAPADPNLAWSEGFATYWSMVVNGRPIYIDTKAGGGWSYNGDTSVTAASLTAPMNQDVSEDMVTEDLWDLGDATAPDDDGVSISHGEVVRVEPEYLRSAALRNVGEPGVDLVDFLDGWFLSQGLPPCAGARAVVSDTRHFPYDYAGPAGACP